jgi:hypothetical protein
MTKPLSPAAQAVRNAYHKICEDYIETWLNFNHNRGLAAALQAAANELTDASSAHTLYAIAGELNDIPYLSLNPKIPTDS